MTLTLVSRRVAALATGLAIAASAPLAAEASGASPQIAQPRVAVPHVPTPGPGPWPGNGVAGCWQGQRLIYGPYAFSFCSNGAYGNYTVRGGQLNCNGSVKVARGPGNSVTINLSRSRCNGWTDWSADRLVCKPAGGVYHGPYDRNIRTPLGVGPNVAMPNVAVPHVPAPRVPVAAQRLDCTYYPTVHGYRPVGLALSRN